MEPNTHPPVPTGGVPKVIPEGSVGDVNSTAKGSGARFNSGKPPMDLVPITALYAYYHSRQDYWPYSPDRTRAVDCLRCLGLWQEDGKEIHLLDALRKLGDGWDECAHVFDYGRKKYAEWNWAKGMAWSIPLGCAVRHLQKILAGEQNDPESGLSHRGHIFCNIAMLQTFMLTYPEGDDRPRYLVRADA